MPFTSMLLVIDQAIRFGLAAKRTQGCQWVGVPRERPHGVALVRGRPPQRE